MSPVVQGRRAAGSRSDVLIGWDRVLIDTFGIRCPAAVARICNMCWGVEGGGRWWWWWRVEGGRRDDEAE